MFVLDTNVLSEFMKSSPAPDVVRWFARQQRNLVYTTVVSKAEILAGIAMMPRGRRQRDLDDLAMNIFGTGFRDRVLAFDDATTVEFAAIARARRLAGRQTGTFDLIIAAIARANDAIIVTRDVAGFVSTGVPVLNPWEPVQP